jgi:YbbR domain-containing protein
MKKLQLHPGLVTDSWELKLTALGLALLLWAAVRSEDTTRFTMNDVPVEVRVTDESWVHVGAVEPQTVTVDFIGPVGELIRLAFAEATLVVPVEDVEDTLELYRPRAEWLDYEGRFEALRVDEILPAALRMRFQPIERRTMPVTVRLQEGLETSARPVIEPAEVMVHGRRDHLDALGSVFVRVNDLEAALDGSLRLRIDTTGTGVTVQPEYVSVHLEPVTAAEAEQASEGTTLQ